MKLKVKIPIKSLETLTDQQLIDVANDLLQLKEANKNKTLERYLDTSHPGQKRFHKDSHRIRIITAGNRRGKTSCGMVELIWFNNGNHPYKKCKVPIKSAVVLQDFENHGKNIFEKKLDEWVPPGSIKRIERHQGGCIKKIHWSTGSVTDVYSHDQELKTFEGSDYDIVWFDEPPPKNIWNAFWRSVTDRGGFMYLTGTPLACDWLYKEYQKWKGGLSPLVTFIEFSDEDNLENIGNGSKALGLRRMEEFYSQLDPEEKEARKSGSFLQLRGLIFKNWHRGTHLIDEFEIPAKWPIYESIDPHPQKPWAVSWMALAPNGAKILIQSNLFDGTIDEIGNQIILVRDELPREDGIKLRVTKCLIDNAASVPTWQRSHSDPTARRISVREELQNVIGPRGAGGPVIEVCPKNVQGKIELFRGWLQVKERDGSERADFYVFEGDRNEVFISEIENYIWDRLKRKDGAVISGKPVKKNDDILDTVMQVALTLKQGKLESSGDNSMILGTETYLGGANNDNRGSASVKTRRDSFG